MPGYHAAPFRKAWLVRKHGASRATAANLTQEQAWTKAKALAAKHGVTAYLHDKDGSVIKRSVRD